MEETEFDHLPTSEPNTPTAETTATNMAAR